MIPSRRTLVKAQNEARAAEQNRYLVPDGKGGHTISSRPQGASHLIRSGGGVQSLAASHSNERQVA